MSSSLPLPNSVSPSPSLSLSESDPAATATSPRFNQVCVKANFKDSRPYNIAIKQKAQNFHIVLPIKLTGNNKRGYVAFSKCSPFGVNPVFGKFIQRKLLEEVKSWHYLVDAYNWYQSRRLTWRDSVSSIYRTIVTRVHVAVSRSPRAVSLVANRKPTDSVIVFPLPDFHELWTSKSACGKVQSIRIRLTKATKKDKAAAHLYFPGAFFSRSQGKLYSLGAENGVNLHWVRFVSEYMRYCIYQWKSFDDAKTWIMQYKMMFVDFVQKLWKFGGGNAKPVNEFWSIRPSTLPVDQEYVGKGWFPASAQNEPGYGLWCTKPGALITIKFTGPVGITERTKGIMTVMQGYYSAKIDNTAQVVPNVNCFKCGVMHHAFLVGHRREKDDPTHRGAVIDGVPCLIPLRPARLEEICFDYGYHLSDVEDIMPIPDE